MKSQWIFAHLFVAVTLTTPLRLQAGQEGNGGDVIYCTDPNGKVSVELLDFYEARSRGIQIDLGAPTLSVDDKIALALNRLEPISPSRASRYRDWSAAFDREANYRANVQLVDIPDSAHIALPKGCEIRQIAIQIEPRFDEDRRYTIDLDLWNLLDANNKAGLKLHEMIYREAREYRHNNSIATRYFTAYISSEKVNQIQSLDDKIKFFVTDLRFPRLDVQGVELSWRERAPIINDKGFVVRGEVERGTKVTIGNYTFAASGLVWFDEEGKPTRFQLSSKPQPLHHRDGRLIGMIKDRIQFHPNGEVRSFNPAQPLVIQFENQDIEFITPQEVSDLKGHVASDVSTCKPVSGRDTSVCPLMDIYFHPNGAIASGWVRTGTEVSVLGQRYLTKSRMEFYPSGRLKAFFPLEPVVKLNHRGFYAIAGNKYEPAFLSKGSAFPDLPSDVKEVDGSFVSSTRYSVPRVEFFESDQFKSIPIAATFEDANGPSTPSKLMSDTYYLFMSDGPTDWSQQGTLLRANVRDGSWIEHSGHRLNLKNASDLQLYPDGSICRLTTKTAFEARFLGQAASVDGFVELSPTGEVIEASLATPLKKVRFGDLSLNLKAKVYQRRYRANASIGEMPGPELMVFLFHLNDRTTFYRPLGEKYTAERGDLVGIDRQGILYFANDAGRSRHAVTKVFELASYQEVESNCQ